MSRSGWPTFLLIHKKFILNSNRKWNKKEKWSFLLKYNIDINLHKIAVNGKSMHFKTSTRNGLNLFDTSLSWLTHVSKNGRFLYQKFHEFSRRLASCATTKNKRDYHSYDHQGLAALVREKFNQTLRFLSWQVKCVLFSICSYKISDCLLILRYKRKMSWKNLINKFYYVTLVWLVLNIKWDRVRRILQTPIMITYDKRITVVFHYFNNYELCTI